jgi:hypothetical protein
MTYYKILVGGKSCNGRKTYPLASCSLRMRGKTCNGGKAEWFLPTTNGKARWMPMVKGELDLCQNGYQIVKSEHITRWLCDGAEIYEVEPMGRVLYGNNRGVCRSARLIRRLVCNDRTYRHFACDCAERGLPVFEHAHPDDNRPRHMVETLRRFTDGEATAKELATALHDAWATGVAGAAWAAWAAGGALVGWAAGAAREARAVWDAGALGTTALEAAGPVGEAAVAAERKWQTKRFLDYLYGRRKP